MSDSTPPTPPVRADLIFTTPEVAAAVDAFLQQPDSAEQDLNPDQFAATEPAGDDDHE